jgi:hypothetical protein
MHVLDWRGGYITWSHERQQAFGSSVLEYLWTASEGDLAITGHGVSVPRIDVMRDTKRPLVGKSELDRRSERLWAGKCACTRCEACLEDAPR